MKKTTPGTCVECLAERPAEDPARVGAEERKKLGLCRRCHFWLKHVASSGEPESVRIEGQHYRLGPEDGLPWPRGFGGAELRIVWLDDEREPTTSTNLWIQGQIPERFRDRLPDNARFGQPRAEAEENFNFQ